ncbi:MAG: DsbA family protein [Hyphomicrobiales bacterium]|nr:DsbA family protein [Hyphomicrobiales bacterium]
MQLNLYCAAIANDKGTNHVQISRSTLIGGLAAIALIVIAGGAYWYSTSDSGMLPGGPDQQSGATWSGADELLKPGPLKEMELGTKDAPITVIEYASMTCGHCANFHNNIYPEFKAKYIDTGKVRFIFREFPLDPLAAGAFMLARCTESNYFGFVEMLFDQQEAWTETSDPVDALFSLSKQAGFTEESFDKCLSNQQLLDEINAVKDRAEKLFDVDSTPTFFVNGQIARGVQTVDDFEKLFAAQLTN